ncbi:hypothetical protein GIV23_15235 [Pseudomonas sp. PA-1-2A]|uniref:hypothetical protein n=3 Tax=Pseudomonas TaxID=286 RepID=UPI001EF0C9D9|nr:MULTISPECIES: hypothetical protein [Pseudomonas]MCF5692772.1 hypothetical protein [Pseudomonas sp. PA-1-8C]MCF5790050.1 hypothetical protein [Pseudomonas sp. PA-1-6G]MCF5794687.1 hypothetical protein [Pseudomonas sp. PA-1-6B]MCF5800690.1 hypothetical protein [Pseudomonas sp. PA-1-5A]MCF5814663.1 hypothetical protein [Pseudomonas sp. PA-1-2A]
MDLKSETKNQHFLSQTEQRLNSLNPDVDVKKQRIYEFELVEREEHKVALRSPKGVVIGKTLSLYDLFSFDVLKDSDRYNFEALFTRYEANTKKLTNELIRKLDIPGSNIAPEIVNIFAIKFLNFVRNPFSVKKILNTFPSISSVQPTDPIHLANFNRVLTGRKPQQRYLCEKLGISEVEYVSWLAILFILLTPLAKGGSNFLNDMVEGLFDSKELFVAVFIHDYDKHSCLLSDRGYSTPMSEDQGQAFDFNVHSKCFIRYVFQQIDSLIPAGYPQEFVEMFKATKKIDARYIRNDLKALEIYNKHVIYQCHSQVFCAEPDFFGF